MDDFTKYIKHGMNVELQIRTVFNLHVLYNGKLFHCHMLDESTCHLGVSSLFCRFYSILDGKSC